MMVLKYTGGNDWGRSELNYGTRIIVLGTYRTDKLGYVSKDALPEIKECVRDMRIRLSFNSYNPFSPDANGFLLFWQEV